jgi:hypothetical protein
MEMLMDCEGTAALASHSCLRSRSSRSELLSRCSSSWTLSCCDCCASNTIEIKALDANHPRDRLRAVSFVDEERQDQIRRRNACFAEQCAERFSTP